MATQGSSMSHEESIPFWFIGQHESSRALQADPSRLLRQAQNEGYDILTTPVTTLSFHNRVLSTLQRYFEQQHGQGNSLDSPGPLIAPLMPTDTTLGPENCSSAFIAVTSPWIDLGSSDPVVAHVSRQVFNLEVQYAAFCGISNVLVRVPVEGSEISLYARAILEALGMGPYLQLHIQVPVSGELEDADDGDVTHLAELARSHYSLVDQIEIDELYEPDLYTSWDTWDAIRTLCNYHPRLSVALELSRQHPTRDLQSRWYSEPLRLLVFPRTSFLRNAKGYPVLSKTHQQLLTKFMRLRHAPWLLLCDVDIMASTSGDETDRQQSLTPSQVASPSPSPEPTPAEAARKSTENKKTRDPVPHLSYLRYLQKMQPSRPPMERFGQGYQDYLQSPLQPLTDNLESITYEVFEKDPVKYEWYEKAVALALQDLRHAIGNREAIIAVVGSGRGPLVARSLLASKQTGVPAKVWAVEKNLNAHVLLQRRAATDNLWRGNVTVVKTDMRAWQGPIIDGQTRKVDIMVSELLGSFADNELSPECLDGVQHVLHPEHGVNIPQSYSAHFTPIATPKIYADLLSRPGGTGSEKWEIPYVAMLQQFDFLSMHASSTEANELCPDVREAWSFSHPISRSILAQGKARAGGSLEAGGAGGAVGGDGSNEHNSRSCSMRFKCANRGVCHGLAGYFESVLYKSSSSTEKVELSTNPLTMDEMSKDMISWFPIFFPLQTPLFVPDGAEVAVTMWRQTDDRKVWYEWVAEVSETTKGRKRRLGMSELHSSRRNGCLM